ncbi:hypothetical protein [Streptomonospora litoralis]|uniref:Uncharacterized protein n=1 Tax=Streptomonospora litoralis TaxID=2498135 RepID=A0A4P6PZZ1_9ACTN|nr:hypothetical protein [Streptomonospora litoralis]QBI52491.1 hypothetical protein EKD16_03400 [Streptomonospora litoralis]
MPDSWMRAAAAGLSGALLLAPLAVEGAAAQGIGVGGTSGSGRGWIEEDLGEAARVRAELTGDGGLRLPTGTPGGAGRAADSPGPLVTFPGHPLEQAADAVAVRLDHSGGPGGLLVEARGVRTDGMWTQWRGARPEADKHGELRATVGLPEAVARLQVRIGIAPSVETGGTAADRREGRSLAGVLSAVRLRPLDRPEDGDTASEGGDGRQEPATERSRPFSARVFATRIGQVGQLTANGHRIGESDHFVALPSRRGLSQRHRGDYTVRVCTGASAAEDTPNHDGRSDVGDAASPDGETETGSAADRSRGSRGPEAGTERRCVYAPVWDVGPWNITDDHWNADRERWDDLTRGLPQAQAAYQDGYNGGRDGFGRRVRNPAGIDLADGTFREGLKLGTNAWVRVDYLWTAEYADRAAISSGGSVETVAVRSGPGTSYPERGLAAAAAEVDVTCRVAGEKVTGPQGVSARWFRIGPADYVPAAYVRGGNGAPECPRNGATE